MTRRSLKAWYFVHKWTSLVCMVFLLLLCVTGLPLIFHHEIDHALGYSIEAPDLGTQAARMSQAADPDAIVADAARRGRKAIICMSLRRCGAWVEVARTPSLA